MTHGGTPPKALVVEDNELFRYLLRGALGARFPFLQVFEADDLPKARRLAYELLPDLVLMDIRLPSGSGLDLTRELTRGDPRVKIVVCTSHDLPEYREAAHACGAAGFVTKGSLSMDALLDMVEPLIPSPGRPPS